MPSPAATAVARPTITSPRAFLPARDDDASSDRRHGRCTGARGAGQPFRATWRTCSACLGRALTGRYSTARRVTEAPTHDFGHPTGAVSASRIPPLARTPSRSTRGSRTGSARLASLPRVVRYVHGEGRRQLCGWVTGDVPLGRLPCLQVETLDYGRRDSDVGCLAGRE